MAKPARFTPKNTPSGWCVNVPAKFSRSGKRERHFYKTRALADDASKKLRDERDEFGVQAKAIAPSLAEDATAAAALLVPLGIPLLEAVRRFVESENRARASATIEDAVTAFRASKEGSSDKQATAYRLRGEKLVAAFGKRMITSITGEELQTHLDATTGGAGAFNQNLRLVRAIWRWCAKPPRKWCDEEAVKHLESKESSSGEIGTLTAKEAAKLLQTAEKHYPDCVIPFAVALFTGMRQAELERLEPEDFTADGITIPAVNAKTKRRRFIHMPEPLAAWLKAYPVGDEVIPGNWQRKEKAVRRLAGWKVWCSLIDPAEPSDDLPEWPANALRHTAASVRVALGDPIERLVFEHGHAGGLSTLRKHYVGTTSKREALAIWSIGPNGKKLLALKSA